MEEKLFVAVVEGIRSRLNGICWLMRGPGACTWLLGVLGLVLGATGCAGFHPRSLASVPFQQRAVRAGDAAFGVEVAVPSASETARLFGEPLYRKGIQPVWVRVVNHTRHAAFIQERAIDAEYFSPLEAAYQFHRFLAPHHNAHIDLHFLRLALDTEIQPGGTNAGFVLANLDLGGKHVNVTLLTTNGMRTYPVVVDVPGLRRDYDRVNWSLLTNRDSLVECDAAQLREELQRLPACAVNRTGDREGDPLNLVVIGNRADLHAFLWCGWSETERLTARSALRTTKSFLFHKPYRYSPISAMYVFGRRQDLALQKARRSVGLRNHLRLWLTPFRFDGKEVWIGQISRDIGVRFTLHTWNLTTHRIDPDVDEARDYLIQDLLAVHRVTRIGYVRGVGVVPPDAPRRNLTGDEYATDGLRAVIEVSEQPVATSAIRFFGWASPPRSSHAFEQPVRRVKVKRPDAMVPK